MTKVDLYVNGNIISNGDVLTRADAEYLQRQCYVSENEVDLSEAIIIDGDLVVDEINFGKKIVCCAGDIVKKTARF